MLDDNGSILLLILVSLATVVVSPLYHDEAHFAKIYQRNIFQYLGLECKVNWNKDVLHIWF